MFDKKEFSKLLKKAIGNRTTTEYADESGVNRTYISKLLNKKLNNPPSPEILKRLAEVAHNGVTYEDFMIAAGYFTIKNLQLGKIEKIKEDNKLKTFWQEFLNEIIKQGLSLDDISPKELVRIYKIIKEFNKEN